MIHPALDGMLEQTALVSSILCLFFGINQYRDQHYLKPGLNVGGEGLFDYRQITMQVPCAKGSSVQNDFSGSFPLFI